MTPVAFAALKPDLAVTSFAVDDVRSEFKRLRELGVQVTQEPADMGQVTTAVLDDSCGNLIQITQLNYRRSAPGS